MNEKRYKILETAIDEIGNHDLDEKNPSRYRSGGYNWCGEFVSWVYSKAGYPLKGGEFSSQVPDHGDDGDWMYRTTGRLIDYFTLKSDFVTPDHKNWYSLKPLAGDFVWIGRYNYDDGTNDRLHAGIVEYMGEDGTLHTIEGNNSGRPVMRFSYPHFKTNATDNGIANGIVMGIGVLP